jgi:hypothetical protein
MTPEERTTQLEVLGSLLDFSTLPHEAVLFLLDYLLHPAARAKVGRLLAEAQRLHAKEEFGAPYYEHVGHLSPVWSFLVVRPNGEGGMRVISNIALDHLIDHVEDHAVRWAGSARVGEFYNTEGTYVLVRTS